MVHSDFLNELGELALGSRLKRMSDRMLADAANVYQQLGMEIQPKWFTLVALLHKKKQVSVYQASQELGISQPAVSQFCRQLLNCGLIDVNSDPQDSRKKVMSLSECGHQQVEAMLPVWRAVEKAAKEMCEAFENDFYQSLLKFEKAQDEKSLLARTLEHMEGSQNG